MKKLLILFLLFALVLTSCNPNETYDRYDVTQKDVVENGVAKVYTSITLFEDYQKGASFITIGDNIYSSEIETTVDSIEYYLNVEKEKADAYVETYKERNK